MRKLGDLGFAVYGHAKFADTPRGCWGAQPWIAYDDSLSGTAEMQWLAAMEPSPRKVLKVNSLSTMVRACRAGVGMALLPCIMGEQEGLQRIGDTSKCCAISGCSAIATPVQSPALKPSPPGCRRSTPAANSAVRRCSKPVNRILSPVFCSSSHPGGVTDSPCL
jgi:hypothetical protein